MTLSVHKNRCRKEGNRLPCRAFDQVLSIREKQPIQSELLSVSPDRPVGPDRARSLWKEGKSPARRLRVTFSRILGLVEDGPEELQARAKRWKSSMKF